MALGFSESHNACRTGPMLEPLRLHAFRAEFQANPALERAVADSGTGGDIERAWNVSPARCRC